MCMYKSDVHLKLNVAYNTQNTVKSTQSGVVDISQDIYITFFRQALYSNYLTFALFTTLSPPSVIHTNCAMDRFVTPPLKVLPL